MAKKDFELMNIERASLQESSNAGQVNTAVATATSRRGQQGTASPQEAADRAAQLRTQGRKGCKAPRINMALTTDNHEFIRIMAGVTGMTMTGFTNFVIAKYREEHPDLYEKAKAIKDNL